MARSGNHLFIAWLLSGLDDNNNNIVYFNNVKYYEFLKPKKINDEFKEEINKSLIKYRAVCSDNKIVKLDERLMKKLASRSYVKRVVSGQVRSVGTLIITFENKKSDILKIVENEFVRRVRATYKVMVIRDFLNVVASRLETEMRGLTGDYGDDVDATLLDTWYENHEQRATDIVFNYNKFLCDDKFKESLALRLDMVYARTYLSQNAFGRTRGSSFAASSSATTTLRDYFTRFAKHANNKFMLECLNDARLIGTLCRDFELCVHVDGGGKYGHATVCGDDDKHAQK